MELIFGHTHTHGRTNRWTDRRGSQNSYLDEQSGQLEFFNLSTMEQLGYFCVLFIFQDLLLLQERCSIFKVIYIHSKYPYFTSFHGKDMQIHNQDCTYLSTLETLSHKQTYL